MRDDVERLRLRTKAFALRVIRMYDALPPSKVAQALGYQAFRAGTSVGAQYRDETGYWLELLVESEIVPARRLGSLIKEADELTRIFVTTVKNISVDKSSLIPQPSSL